MAKHVQHACVRGRNPQPVGLLLQMIEPRGHGAAILRFGPGSQLVFQETQFAIQPRYLPPHHPSVDRRQESQQRIQDAEDRDQHHEQPGDQRRCPERKVVLQERPSRFVELDGFAAERSVNRFRGGKLSGAPEYSGAGMDLDRGVEKQELNRGMHVVANDKAGFRREQRHVGWRPVIGEIADAGGNDHFVQERIKRDIGVGVRKADELDTFVRQQLADDRRFPGNQDDRCVDLARQQLFTGDLRRISEKLDVLAVDALPLEQFERQRARPAAFGADRNFSAAQLVKSLALEFAALEQPQGLVEHRSQRFDFRRFVFVGRAALDQGDAHPGAPVAQQGEIGHGACRRYETKPDALPREDFLVAFSDLMVGAALGARRHDDGPRRHGPEHGESGNRHGGDSHGGREERPVPSQMILDRHIAPLPATDRAVHVFSKFRFGRGG